MGKGRSMRESHGHHRADRPPWRNKNILTSFKVAFEGMGFAYRERNIKIISVMGLAALVAGAVLGLTPLEYCVLILVSATVFALEVLNTALEHLADLVESKYSRYVKIVKDLSAFVVLFYSFVSVAVGILLFGRFLGP